jgi:hypothetical protein
MIWNIVEHDRRLWNIVEYSRIFNNYTDASKRNCDGKTGAAICRINGKNTKDWSWFLESCMEVFDAELFAIREAVY